jgi:hypothetical protein
MEMQEMDYALRNLEAAIDALRDAGEDGLADKAIALMADCLDRYEAEGGDRLMFDAALS